VEHANNTLRCKACQAQGLIQAATLASTPAMGAAIRRVLGGLHGQKQAPGVDAMLLRLYEPIIFRCAPIPRQGP